MTKFKCTLDKIRKYTTAIVVFFAMYGWFSFADYCGAKSGVKWRDITQAGVVLWVFLILGAAIILMQLIPAILLFFSFIGRAHKSVRVTNEVCEPAIQREEE